MQKILTKEERERKTKIKQLLIGGVLILIMVLATAGYSLMSGDNQDSIKVVNYKGVKFVQGDDSYWRFNQGGVDFMTQYNPTELNDTKVSLIGLSVQTYQGKVIYTAGEPDEAELLRNIYQLIQSGFIGRYGRACITENCSENAPLKNCSEDYIIITQEAKNNETEKIYQDEKCVYIISSYANQTRYIDAYLYKILGLD
jgi:hypothetical protein